ncbi:MULTISPECIES: GumC family protein [Niastella]|uniref:Polysaccharide biosynthesis tyrosine autokinase n=1 Tax=Niastella soli TaxID=2821487 RepID=A0ABS3YQI5_9BACT|nr:tyrosine-protein kinase [Niastella soli]MBO9200135.1 polysaccharide biosynthesis tyrosine autokinase [Niastella soli]
MGSGGGGDKFDDIFMMQRTDKLGDEIEIIKSRNMAARVVRSLGLQKQMYNKGKIQSTVLHTSDEPFNFEIQSIADSSRGFSLLITMVGDNQFRINEQPQIHYFDQPINLPIVSFKIRSNGRDRRGFASEEFMVSWQPVENIALGLSEAINVNRTNDVTNVLNLSFQTENTKLGVDVVNQYMKEYQQASLEDKKQIAAQTLSFIDDQLDTVFMELGGVERNLQKYREKNRVIKPDMQAQLSLGEYTQTNTEQGKMGVKIKVIDQVLAYISDDQNRFKIVPSLMGIDNAGLSPSIMDYNKLQLERESSLRNTPHSNPVILTMEARLDKMRLDMIETLKNVRQSQMLELNQIQGKTQETNRLITSIPSKEKQMLEVTRQQSILQELYQYLLQKKLETAIASASTISNIKVIEPAMQAGGLVSPNKKGIYMIALFLGVAIPIGIVFLLEFLNDKVKSKSDIEQNTAAPILGEIGHSEEGNALVVTKNNRKFVAEQFRVIRSNLQYILPKVDKPVMLVTSSFSGEGKSFISTNIGSVIALSGKRTVILEFDIRKPKIMHGLGLHERKGITNYLVGSVSLNEVLYPVPGVDNLFVLPCGPVPPNPAEMLLNEMVDKMFRELKSQFDTIIIDTAPVGLVSDAISLSKFADSSIYIVRHGYTLKKQLQLIDEIYQQNKLPRLSIIINDIKGGGSYGGYYGYGGFGYGYGYGYGGNGNYFESDSSKKNKGWRKWITIGSKKQIKNSKQNSV